MMKSYQILKHRMCVCVCVLSSRSSFSKSKCSSARARCLFQKLYSCNPSCNIINMLMLLQRSPKNDRKVRTEWANTCQPVFPSAQDLGGVASNAAEIRFETSIVFITARSSKYSIRVCMCVCVSLFLSIFLSTLIQSNA